MSILYVSHYPFLRYNTLIFDHLNELLFPSYCKNFHLAAAMKPLNFREEAKINDNSQVSHKEQWKRFRSMETKKLHRKKESKPQRCLQK